MPHLLFCLVDSSWTTDNEMAGIGWKLYDRAGADIMTGSSSIEPIASSLEAEAFALRDAVYQVKRHGYINVAFVCDSETLHKSLTRSLDGHSSGRNQQCNL